MLLPQQEQERLNMRVLGIRMSKLVQNKGIKNTRKNKIEDGKNLN